MSDSAEPDIEVTKADESSDIRPTQSAKIQNGVLFLRNPAVRNSSLTNRVNFLKGKGLSMEEISRCFTEAGTPQTLDVLKAAASGSLAVAPPNVAPPLPPAQHAQSHPSVPTVSEAWTWKDYFVGATISTLAAMGIYQYSPYHVVPKDELDALRRAVAQGGKQRAKKSRSRRETNDIGIVEGNFAPSSDGGAVAAPPSAAPPALPTSTEEKPSLEEELEKAKKEAQEKSADADKARREKAELAANNGKLKGQLMQVNRSLERTETEVSKLKKRIEEMEKEAAPAPPQQEQPQAEQSPTASVPDVVPAETVPEQLSESESTPALQEHQATPTQATESI